MIKWYTKEQLSERGLDPDRFCGVYSDQGLYIQKYGTEEVYSEAIDLIPCEYRYIETDKKINIEEPNNMEV